VHCREVLIGAAGAGNEGETDAGIPRYCPGGPGHAEFDRLDARRLFSSPQKVTVVEAGPSQARARGANRAPRGF